MGDGVILGVGVTVGVDELVGVWVIVGVEVFVGVVVELGSGVNVTGTDDGDGVVVSVGAICAGLHALMNRSKRIKHLAGSVFCICPF